MKYMSKEQFFAAHEGYGFISKALEQFGEEFVKNFCDRRTSLKSVDYFVDEDDEDGSTGTIDLVTSTYMCGCCYPDERDYYTFPLHYLWDENWVGREYDKREADRIERERKEAEEDARMEREHQEKRYQTYLAMKEEFENGN